MAGLPQALRSVRTLTSVSRFHILMTARVPAALFFVGLLACHGSTSAALVGFAAAFVPPYLSLLDWRRPADS